MILGTQNKYIRDTAAFALNLRFIRGLPSNNLYIIFLVALAADCIFHG
jgi:hypothetical protein